MVNFGELKLLVFAFENVFPVSGFYQCVNSPIWSTCKFKIYLSIKAYILLISDKILSQGLRISTLIKCKPLSFPAYNRVQWYSRNSTPNFCEHALSLQVHIYAASLITSSQVRIFAKSIKYVRKSVIGFHLFVVYGGLGVGKTLGVSCKDHPAPFLNTGKKCHIAPYDLNIILKREQQWKIFSTFLSARFCIEIQTIIWFCRWVVDSQLNSLLLLLLSSMDKEHDSTVKHSCKWHRYLSLQVKVN